MRVKAQRWGNSLAVRIPKAIADQAGVRERDEMEVEVAEGVIQLRHRVEEISLECLLTGITPENLHGEMDDGLPIGHEAW
jgi:antitoxin MazE